MGARAQVLIEDTGVYLYTHWGSGSIVSDVKRIIGTQPARSRWDDPEYLTRIIFCQLVKDDIDGETGYGIGTEEHGDIDLLVTVNCEHQAITFPGGEMTFKECV